MKHFLIPIIAACALVLLMALPAAGADNSLQCSRFCDAAATCKDPGFDRNQCLDICAGIEEHLQPSVAQRFLACQMKDMCSPAEDKNCLETATQNIGPLPELKRLLTVFCRKMNACVPDDSRLTPKRCVELFTEQRLGVFLSAKGIALVTDCLKTCNCKGIDACFNRVFEGRKKGKASAPPATVAPKTKGDTPVSK